MFTGKWTIRHLLWATAILAIYFSALTAAVRWNLIGWGIVATIPLLVLTLVAYALVYWLALAIAWATFQTGRVIPAAPPRSKSHPSPDDSDNSAGDPHA